jgi:membrane associated rhomboid family serine protease
VFPLRDANPRTGPAFVTWILIAANVALFLYQLSLPSQRALFDFVVTYGFVPQEFFANPVAEALPVLTSMFLHGGLFHLVGNMLFLFVFGDNIENRMGHGAFVLFYLLGGALATLAHGLFAPGSQTPMIGASGAVSAVLGAYIVLFPRQRVLTFVPPLFLFWLPAWLYIGYWALLQFVQATGGVSGGVAWWAHVGGFVFGVAVVRVFASSEARGTRRARGD